MKNSTIVLVFLIVIVCVGFFAFRTKPKSETPVIGSITTETVSYYGNVNGYLAYPSDPGTYPGIILIHEWWGLNDDIRLLAEDFAKEGYVALAVDMYNGESTTERERAQELSSSVRNNVEDAFENLGAAVSYLKGLPYVDSTRLASIGWCFGGGWAYQMAVNGLDIDASVMYYGQFDPEDDFEMMKTHILGHFGENDTSITIDRVNEFQAALATTNGMHEVYIYPNVGHGFANERGGDNVAYSKEAADLAWERTTSFLRNVFSK